MSPVSERSEGWDGIGVYFSTLSASVVTNVSETIRQIKE